MKTRTVFEVAATLALLQVAGPVHAEPMILTGEATGDEFAVALALGDADGDGYADLLVGAPAALGGAGRLSLYRGGPGGLSPTPSFVLDGDQPGAHLGATVAYLGDFDGDGLADFAAAAPDHTTAGAAGSAHGRVIALRSTGAEPQLEVLPVADGARADTRLGLTLCGPGDLDGDGRADLVIGAPDADDHAGLVAVHLSIGPAFEGEPRWLLTGLPGQRIGHALATVWDVDGDTLADLLVRDGLGDATLYPGASTGGDASAAPIDAYAIDLPADVGAVGDLDGDGRADLFDGAIDLGAPPFPIGDRDADGVPDFAARTSAGVVLFDGATLTETALLVCQACDPALVRWGESIAAGDIDGDGRTDLVIGAPAFPVSGEARGVAFVYLAQPAPRLQIRQSWSHPGASPRLAHAIGDSDDDGFDDLLVATRDGLVVALGSPIGELVTRAIASALDPSRPFFVEAADFDADGGVDIALAGQGQLEVHWSDGSAPWRVTASARSLGTWLTSGDFDGDGVPDLLVGAALDLGRLAAFLYRGRTTRFSSDPDHVERGHPLSTGAPGYTAIGDVDGAGGIDLLVLGDTLALAFSAPPSTASPLALPSGPLPEVRPGGDVDGDGFDDLVLGTDPPMLLRGARGDDLTTLAPLGHGLPIGDLDRDGRADLVRLDPPEVAFGAGLAHHLALPDTGHALIAIHPAGDVDGDGAADLLLVDSVATHLVTAPSARRLAIAARARDLAGDHTLQPQVVTRVPDRFRVEARRVSLTGLPAATLELAFAPSGAPLPDLADPDAIPLSSLADPSLATALTSSKLPDGALLRWRARLRYDLATAPLQATTPWVTGAVGPRAGFIRMRAAVAPTANDDRYPLQQHGALTVTAPGLLGNDLADPLAGEASSGPLIVDTTPVIAPTRGNLTLLPDGAFFYIPTAGAWGTDRFVYRVRDHEDRTDTAEVTLDILPIEACFQSDPDTCRAGQLRTTLRRADGSLLAVTCTVGPSGLTCTDTPVDTPVCPAPR